MERRRGIFRFASEASRILDNRLDEKSDQVKMDDVFLRESTEALIEEHPEDKNRIKGLAAIAYKSGEDNTDAQFERAMIKAGLTDKQILTVLYAKDQIAKEIERKKTK